MVGAGLRKIVESRACSLDDVPRDERRAFGGALLGALDAAFPLEDRPAVEAVLSQLRENAGEVHLSIAGRPEPAGAIDPRLISAVHTLTSARVKLRVLDVKHLDALVVEIEVLQIIELLQNKMARIEQDVAAGVVAGTLEKHFKGHAVVQIFAGMNLETQVHAGGIEGVQNRLPARGQLIECGFNQTH